MRRPELAPLTMVALLILQGCCGSPDPNNPISYVDCNSTKFVGVVTDKSSELIEAGEEIPEISEFMALGERGDLNASLLDCGGHTLLAPSNKAMFAMGTDALDHLNTPRGFEDLATLLQRTVIHEKVTADELGELLGGAKVLRSKETRDGFLHVIDRMPPGRVFLD